jgi:CRISPR-associated endonuclease Csn1
LKAKGGDIKMAFSPEGIAQMNLDITQYNDGKPHKPILRVRVSEPMGEKYQIGYKGNKGKKYVEAQSGTNLYFAIFEDAEGKRSYQTVPMNYVAERQKLGFLPVPEINEEGIPLKFWLSPNDLVYVSSETERERGVEDIPLRNDRIYKMVSATGNQCFFIRNDVANVLMNKVEFQSLNKMEKSLEGINIKEVCWKLEIDRLGNITKIIK